MSTLYGVRTAAPVVVASVDQRTDVDLVTLLAPRRDGRAPDAALRRPDVGVGCGRPRRRYDGPDRLAGTAPGGAARTEQRRGEPVVTLRPQLTALLARDPAPAAARRAPRRSARRATAPAAAGARGTARPREAAPGSARRTGGARASGRRTASRARPARGWSAPGCSPPARRPPSSPGPEDDALRRGAPPGSVLVDDALDTVFWMFPEDRKLRGLGRADLPVARHAGGARRDRGRAASSWRTPRRRRRRRGARTRPAASSGSRRSRSVTRAGAASPFCVPRDEGVANDGTAAPARCRRLPGGPAHGAVHSGPRPPPPPAAAGPLARGDGRARRRALGAAPTARRRVRSLHAAGSRLASAPRARCCELARPDLAPLVQSLVEALLLAPPARAEPVLLHGDLHPKNVLVHDAGISLVDLDQAGAGPAAAEVGGMLARLWCPRPGRRDHGRHRCSRGRRVPRVVRAGSRAPRPALVRRRGAPRRAGGARRPPGRRAHPGGPGAGARRRRSDGPRTVRTDDHEATATAVLLPALGGARAPGALDAPGRRPGRGLRRHAPERRPVARATSRSPGPSRSCTCPHSGWTRTTRWSAVTSGSRSRRRCDSAGR